MTPSIAHGAIVTVALSSGQTYTGALFGITSEWAFLKLTDGRRAQLHVPFVLSVVENPVFDVTPAAQAAAATS